MVIPIRDFKKGDIYYCKGNRIAEMEFIGIVLGYTYVDCINKKRKMKYIKYRVLSVRRDFNGFFGKRGNESEFCCGSLHHKNIRKIFKTKEEAFAYIL